MTPEDVARLNANREAAMKTFFRLGVIVAAILIVVAVAFFRRLEADTRKKESWIVPPTVDEESVSEIGYVHSLRNEINFREHKRDIMWWVKVPATNKTYSCSWESGYSGFRQDDGVRIIHKRTGVDTVDYSGFIVGLHDNEQGRSAAVWAVDLDDLDVEPDDPPDNP
jgi:hypothetical protein